MRGLPSRLPRSIDQECERWQRQAHMRTGPRPLLETARSAAYAGLSAGEASDLELRARARTNNHVRGVEVAAAGTVEHGARARNRSVGFC